MIDGSIDNWQILATEDWPGFRLALLSSTDFSAWSNQDPVKSAAMIGAIYSGAIHEAKQIFAALKTEYPPSLSQLQSWQRVALEHRIVSIHFI